MVELNYIEIGNRIKSRRKSLGLTQKELGRLVNLSEGSISKYEAGKVTDATTAKLNEFASILGIDIAWLLATPFKSQTNGHLISLPIVGKISCGNGSLAYEEIEGYEPTPEAWLNGGDYFYLRAKGDSMVNSRIFDGDLVLIRRQGNIENGQIGVVLVDDQAFLKKVYVHEHILKLESTNPIYQTIDCNTREQDCRIIGILKKIIVNV